ncbi:MAG: AAA family ATPase [Chloroflexi bacterium]|nr:AAA family ATPase [Chloroflexota bacterium]
MSQMRRVQIRRLSTGVPGLDEVLGDGLPEYSFNLVAGGPGTGKTILVHQFVFTNASTERPALYITVVGEPPLKMLRYQQQFNFFDPRKVETAVHFVNLEQEVLDKGLDEVYAAIARMAEETKPGIVVVDSFRTVMRAAKEIDGEMTLQGFAQRLATFLTGWRATTFLVGEHAKDEVERNPVFTVADGIFWLYQSVERNSVVRKLQVMKLRGQASVPGLHTFRISGDGITVFPRISRPPGAVARTFPCRRLSAGVAGLDEMMGGGVPEGDVALVAGPSGSGKSLVGSAFIAAGVRQGERGIIVAFEEFPGEFTDRAKCLGVDLADMVARGDLKLIYLRPLDLSVDETFYEIGQAVGAMEAKRVVIDSVSGFELALAPTFREEFRESLYRLASQLSSLGITLLITAEIVERFDELRFSPHLISFLADDIILLRYVEIRGKLRKVIAVIKMRGSEHSEELKVLSITSQGMVVGESLGEYEGIIGAMPCLRQEVRQPVRPLLNAQEALVFETLVGLGQGQLSELSLATGLQRRPLSYAIDRLVALKRITRAVEEGRTVYRPSPRI